MDQVRYKISSGAAARYSKRSVHRSEADLDKLMHEDVARIEKRLRLKGFSAIEATYLSRSATEGGSTRGTLERIIRENDLTGIQFIIQAYRATSAICRIVIKRSDGREAGYGTGFRISPDLVMTNHHVLPTYGVAAASVAQFSYFENRQGVVADHVDIALDARRFYLANQELDFAIVAIDAEQATGGDMQRRHWFNLIRESGKALRGEKVNVMQHPGGRPLAVALRNNRVLDVFDHFVHYETDTEPGSSGSPVLNDNWELAALHHAGVPRVDKAGVIKVRDPAAKQGFRDFDPKKDGANDVEWVANEGIRISSIVKHLDAENMSYDEQALYEACFVQAPETGMVHEVAAAASRPADEGPGPRILPDGRVAYQFEVVFGPRTVPVVAAPEGRSVQRAQRAQRAEDNLLERAAKRLIENATANKRPYFDKSANDFAKAAYYRGMDFKKEIPLDEIRKVSMRFKPIGSYGKARLQYLYPVVDLQPSRMLASVYSGEEKDPSAAIAEELALIEASNPMMIEILGSGYNALRGESGRLAIESLGAELDQLEDSQRAELNCEHVVPQSWFLKDEPMRSDLHHLFACEWNCNSFRGNSPYFDFPGYPEDAEIMEIRDGELEAVVDREACGRRETNKTNPGFEPAWRVGKAAAARAMLYFLLKYNKVLTGASAVLQQRQIAALLKWHRDVPPGEWEWHRNQEIFIVQEDRNPLIDFPDAPWKKEHFQGAFAQNGEQTGMPSA